jgi:hypothetical protein
VSVVCIHHRYPIGGQGLVDRGILGGDFLHRAHELQVLALRVVDQRHRGPRDAGKIRDLALVVHAELDRAPAVRIAHAKQRQRHADVVVEVSRGRKHRLLAGVAAQDRSQHFLHRGLAVRAGHGDKRGVKARAPVSRERAERKPRIVDHGHRQRKLAAVAAIDYRGGGPRRRGAFQEPVAVEALAAQRDKELSRAQRARVGRYAAEAHIGTARARAEHGGRRREVHHAPLPRCKALRATAASENGRRWPAIS